MKKARRKLTDRDGNTKLRTVWRCHSKIGTHSSTVILFFEEPIVGNFIDGVEETFRPSDSMYAKVSNFIIDEINQEGFVFCSRGW